MAPKAPAAPAPGRGRPKKPSGTKLASQATNNAAIKKRGRPSKKTTADAVKGVVGAASPPKKRARPPKNAIPKADAAPKAAPSKKVAASKAPDSTGKSSKAPAPTEVPAKGTALQDSSSARTTRAASLKQKNTASAPAAAKKANDKPQGKGKAADGYNDMSRQELHELANTSYRRKPRELLDSDTESSLRVYLRAADKRREKAAAAAADPKTSKAKTGKAKRGKKGKGQMEEVNAESNLSTEEKMQFIQRMGKKAKAELERREPPTSPSKASQDGSDDADDDENQQYHDAPTLSSETEAQEQANADQLADPAATQGDTTNSDEQEGQEGEDEQDEEADDEEDDDADNEEEEDEDDEEEDEEEGEEEDEEIYDLDEDEKTYAVKLKNDKSERAKFLKGEKGNAISEAEKKEMWRLSLKVENHEMLQYMAKPDGLCLFHAFAVALYRPELIGKTPPKGRAHELEATRLVRKHLRAWWQRVVLPKNRETSESKSRLEWYRALNDQTLRGPKATRAASAWRSESWRTDIPSPTMLKDRQGESLHEQIMQTSTQPLWASVELVQVLADAFDVEIIVHEHHAKTTDTEPWETQSRGPFGARPIHLLSYVSVGHWTAAKLSDDKSLWVEHLFEDPRTGLAAHRSPQPFVDTYADLENLIPNPIRERTSLVPAGPLPNCIPIPVGYHDYREVDDPLWAPGADPALFGSPKSKKQQSPKPAALPESPSSKKQQSPKPDSAAAKSPPSKKRQSSGANDLAGSPSKKKPRTPSPPK